MAQRDPAKVAAKWSRNLIGARESYIAGIREVVDNPMEKAAAKKQEYVAGVTNNAEKWAANLRAVPMDVWRTNAITAGAERLTSGAQKAQPKVERFLAAFLPFEAQQLAELNRTNPRTANVESNIARASEWMRKMSKFKRNQAAAAGG